MLQAKIIFVFNEVRGVSGEMLSGVSQVRGPTLGGVVVATSHTNGTNVM